MYWKVRITHEVALQATVAIAHGRREVLGVEIGHSEDGAVWTAFPRALRARKLDGVDRVNSVWVVRPVAVAVKRLCVKSFASPWNARTPTSRSMTPRSPKW